MALYDSRTHQPITPNCPTTVISLSEKIKSQSTQSEKEDTMRTYAILNLLIGLFFVISFSAQGQDEVLVEYTFSEETVEAEVVHSNLSASEFQISAGSIIFGTTNAATWTGSGVPFAQGNGGWGEDNADDAKHFFFTIDSPGGSEFSVTNISFLFRATGAGPSALTLTINDDDIVTIDVPANSTESFDHAVSGYENLSGVTVKIKGWDNESRETSGTGQLHLDDVLVEGSVAPLSGPAISHQPLEDTESTDPRTALATITGDDLVTEGENRPALHYRVDGGDWEFTYYLSVEGNNFSFTIPGMPLGSQVEYYIAARDAEEVVTNPLGGSGENPPGSTPPENFHSYSIIESEPDPDPDPDVDELVITLSSDPDDTSEENRVQVPHAGMGTEVDPVIFYGDDDWTYINPEFTFYAVAEGSEEIIAAEFYLEWDHTKGTLTVEEGNYFSAENSVFQVMDVGDGRIRVNASSLQGNVAPSAGSYFAAMTVSVAEPGHYDLTLTDVDLRYYDAGEDKQVPVPAVAHPGEIKFYLGDFGRMDNGGVDRMRGDGVVDFTDLILFADAYWSERGVHDAYRTKYDIGPTNEDGSYFSIPSSDGVIDFEDLVIFAIGYFQSAAGLLPKQSLRPLRIIAHDIQHTGNSFIVPLGFDGPVDDVRAISLEVEVPASALKFISAEPAGELDRGLGFLAAREVDGRVQLDAAIIRSSFSQEGIFAYLRFDKIESADPGPIGVISAIARNSFNHDIPVVLSHHGDKPYPDTPTSFGLSQNFPNPFNPSTTIQYQIPEDVHVHIVVYNVLGEVIAELVHEYQESGFYSVEWDGMSLNNISAPSGLYICRMQAGGFTGIQRLLLIK
jgi:hypothetical protein